jgi:hypothetical protein
MSAKQAAKDLARKRAHECAVYLKSLSVEDGARYITQMLETAYLDGYADAGIIAERELRRSAEQLTDLRKDLHGMVNQD